MNALRQISLMLLTCLVAANLPVSAEDNPWQAMTRTDLDFIHTTLLEHHPGPLNPEDPAFGEWLSAGYEDALAGLGSVTSYGGYRALLRRYAAGFRDGHLSLSFQLDYEYTQWPGFVVAWRNQGFQVDAVAQGATDPRVGDRLIECDGIEAEELYDQLVLPYWGKSIPGDRYLYTPEILINPANPFYEPPSSCTFERSGEQIAVDLNWTWESRSIVDPIRKQASARIRGVFELRDLTDGGAWLTFPTFGPSGKDQERMKALMAELPNLRTHPYIVVDVRGNGGGSSHWTQSFINGLYGEEWANATVFAGNDGGYTVYRVSEDNITHFEEFLPQIESSAGADSPFYRHFATLIDSMNVALANDRELFHYRGTSESESPASNTGLEPLYAGHLFFLTDGFCASACLDFADAILRVPGVVHVGQPTSADTFYMEIRSVTLPSRNARLQFATKYAVGRKRGHNEYYAPTEVWAGDISQSGKIEAWIAKLHNSQKAHD